MKNYIKFGVGVYIGWHLAKTIDTILANFINQNFTDKDEKQKTDTSEAAGGETMNDRNDE